MSEEVVYNDLGKLHSFLILKRYNGLKILKETICSFFGCEVNIYPYPERDFSEKFKINIHDKINRGFYPIDEKSVVLLARIFRSKSLLSSIGLNYMI